MMNWFLHETSTFWFYCGFLSSCKPNCPHAPLKSSWGQWYSHLVAHLLLLPIKRWVEERGMGRFLWDGPISIWLQHHIITHTGLYELRMRVISGSNCIQMLFFCWVKSWFKFLIFILKIIYLHKKVKPTPVEHNHQSILYYTNRTLKEGCASSLFLSLTVVSHQKVLKNNTMRWK